MVGTPASAASKYFSSLFASQNGLPTCKGARLTSNRAISSGRPGSGTASRHSIWLANDPSAGNSCRSISLVRASGLEQHKAGVREAPEHVGQDGRDPGEVALVGARAAGVANAQQSVGGGGLAAAHRHPAGLQRLRVKAVGQDEGGLGEAAHVAGSSSVDDVQWSAASMVRCTCA